MAADARGPALAHRLAVALSAATLALILLGGLVTNTGAALAVPDWPTTFGHNMFLFPWSRIAGGILYEHSHRLLGALVGLLTLALAAALWMAEGRRWLRWLGLAAVLAVSLQGLLGGLRVVLVESRLAIVHGALAQAFLGLTVALAAFTSRRWAVPSPPAGSSDTLALRRLALVMTALVYLQSVLGAFLTHSGLLLEGHVAGALALAIVGSALALRIRRRHGGCPGPGRPARVLLALLLLQLLLGAGAYAVRFAGVAFPLAPYSTLPFPVLHRLTAALLFAASILLTIRGYRLLGPPEPRVARRLFSGEVRA